MVLMEQFLVMFVYLIGLCVFSDGFQHLKVPHFGIKHRPTADQQSFTVPNDLPNGTAVVLLLFIYDRFLGLQKTIQRDTTLEYGLIWMMFAGLGHLML